MNREEKLIALEDMLRNHDKYFKETTFDISLWSSGDIPEEKVVGGKSVTCGSSACALGSAAGYKPFTDLGLYLDMVYSPTASYIKNGEVYEDFDAGAEFFDITTDESNWLFNPNRYCRESDSPFDCEDIDDFVLCPIEITAEMVADRVRQIIEDTDLVEDKTYLGENYEG